MSPQQIARKFLPQWPKEQSELEFLPAALEIVETPPSPAGRAIASSIILFFLIALLWASFGAVDIVATGQGKIIPTGRTKVIQPFETGVVRAIHVQDGQQVKAGDILIEIDSTINEAERDRIQKDYMTAALDAARLKALLNNAGDIPSEFITPEDAPLDKVNLQRSLLASQIAEHRSKLAGIDRQVAQYEGNQAAVQSTIRKITEGMPYLKERAKVRQYLADKGVGSKLEFYTVQQQLVEQEQELKVQQGRLAEAMAGVAALKEQRKQTEAEFDRTTLGELALAEQKAASLHEQLVQASEKYNLQTLKSPVDGTVQQLAVHTVGGVVTPAQMLLAVVPADSRLEIEAMISNRDVGFVQVGHEVVVKIDTFNFTKYGLLNGKVESISQDAIIREKPVATGASQQSGAESSTSEPLGQELVYAARIALEKTQMQVDDRLVNLTPGMAVTVEVKTGKRRIIEYLLSPLFKHSQEAMRER